MEIPVVIKYAKLPTFYFRRSDMDQNFSDMIRQLVRDARV